MPLAFKNICQLHPTLPLTFQRPELGLSHSELQGRLENNLHSGGSCAQPIIGGPRATKGRIGIRAENGVPCRSLVGNKLAPREKLVTSKRNEGKPRFMDSFYLLKQDCQWFALCFNPKNHKKDYVLGPPGNAYRLPEQPSHSDL